jgi:hypothetical protein
VRTCAVDTLITFPFTNFEDLTIVAIVFVKLAVRLATRKGSAWLLDQAPSPLVAATKTKNTLGDRFDNQPAGLARC